MQQHIKTYYAKVEALIASRKQTKQTKKSRKGLLSPTGDTKSGPKEREQIETIADMVEGIRDAKEEMLNARK